MLKCCFTFAETVGFLGTGARDGRLDFHTAPDLCYCCTYTYIDRFADVVIRALTVYVLSVTVCRSAVSIIHAGTFGLVIEPHRFQRVNRRYSFVILSAVSVVVRSLRQRYSGGRNNTQRFSIQCVPRSAFQNLTRTVRSQWRFSGQC